MKGLLVVLIASAGCGGSASPIDAAADAGAADVAGDVSEAPADAPADQSPPGPPPSVACGALGWGGLTALAVSPDGSVIAGGFAFGQVGLFDAGTGVSRGRLPGHAGQVTSVAFAPDGTEIVSAALDGHVRVSRLADRSERLAWEADVGAAWAASYAPDGALIASTGNDKKVKVWSATDGGLVRTLWGDGPWVNDVAFSPDGTLLAAGGGGDLGGTHLRVWRVDDGSVVHSYSIVGNDGVKSLAFSPDGKTLASIGYFSVAVTLRRTSDWTAVGALPYDVQRETVAFSPDGASVATSGSGPDGSSEILRASDGASLATMAAQWPMAFDPGGARLFLQGLAGGIEAWSVPAGVRMARIATPGHTSSLWAARFVADGGVLVSAGADGIRVWDAAAADEIRFVPARSEASDVSPDGLLAASANDVGGGATLWRLSDGSAMASVGGTRRITAIAFSPDGKTVALGGEDHLIQLHAVPDGAATGAAPYRHDALISHVAFSADGAFLASSAVNEPRVLVWRIADGKMLFEIPSYGSVAFSPDGSLLATDTGLWRATDGSRVRVIGAHAVAFSPDGETLALGRGDGSVQMHRVSDGKVVGDLAGGTEMVNALAFSPDGGRLAVGTHGGELRLWCRPSP